MSPWLLGDPATCETVLWAARRLAITAGAALMRMTSSGGLRAVASAYLTHIFERRLPGINLGDTMPPPASSTSRAQRPRAKAQTAPSDRPLSSPLAFSTTTTWLTLICGSSAYGCATPFVLCRVSSYRLIFRQTKQPQEEYWLWECLLRADSASRSLHDEFPDGLSFRRHDRFIGCLQ